ncbi:MAG: hypothetical protein PHH42_05465, partial [Bacteroidales bacterium]|nr:hypothetical protein [Bacteroidales bacterium]MDD4176263.1 hypothetical protein [Bacteroidales bacterium]MDD4740490.1 hypothetical protein [Bacteroidales bacterium]
REDLFFLRFCLRFKIKILCGFSPIWVKTPGENRPRMEKISKLIVRVKASQRLTAGNGKM